MQFKLRMIPAAAATFMLVACGGGAPEPAPVVAAVPTNGKAVDGYLSFAKVVCDTNGNGVADASEPFVYTLADGKFTFPDGCTHGVIATGGSSADTGLPFTGQLKAPAGATMITPLTTLMVAGLTQTQVNAALGLPAGTDLLNTDPALKSGESYVNADLFRKTLAVEQLLQQTTQLLAGLAGATGSATTQPVYNEVAAGFATALAGGAKLNSSATAVDSTVATTLVQAAAQRVATAASVSTGVKTALAAVNLPALATVSAPGMAVQANTILKASDATLTTVTTTAQNSSYITDYVKAKQADLTGTPSAATIAALGTTLTSDVTTGTSSLGGGTGGTTTGTVLVSFDEVNVAFADMGAYGGALPTVVTGPAGGSGNALKIVKPVSPDTWGGVYFTVAPVPFTADRKTITAKVYSSRAGAVIKFKVEIPGGGNVEVASAPTGAANTWSTLSWDFSGVDLSKGYKTIAITPDVDRVTDGQSYYIDEITLAAATTVTPPVSGGALLSFDEATPAFADMGAYGGALPTVVTGPTGGSGNALKIVKPVSPDTWGGVYFTVAAIPFTADRKVITARVNASRAGAVIKFKVEIPGGGNVEVASAPTGAANTWSTLSWDFSAVDLSKGYKTIAITPDVDRVTDGQSYYIDEITLAAAGSGTGGTTGGTAPATAAPTPTALAANVLSIYSDAYTPVAGINLNPGWGQSTAVTEVSVAGNKTEKYATLNYQGIDFVGHAINVSTMGKLHIDVWTPDVTTLKVSLIATTGGGENAVTLTPTLAGWNSYDIDLAGYTVPDKSKIDQIKIEGTPAGGTLYFDNLYFWKTPSAADTVPPTLAIADNLAAATATAPVTYTFTFSEDVGSSFDASDIVVTGGTLGALTKVDATHYTSVVTPTANATGNINVSVAAGKFLDLANNANTAASSATHAFNTTTPAPTDYVSLTGNAISLFNGSSTTSFSMTDFQSAAGISVKWPMANTAALRLQLAETGNFTMAAGQTLTAAVQITETRAGGLGEIRGYIENVSITKTGNSVTLTVPNPASALIYGVSGDGTKSAVINFSSAVAGVKNTLTTAANMLNNIVFGDVVAYAVNNVSNDFTGINALRGKYKVTLVVTDLPLRKTDGSKFPAYTIQVPTKIGATGTGTDIKPVTGWGLEGYITLTD